MSNEVGENGFCLNFLLESLIYFFLLALCLLRTIWNVIFWVKELVIAAKICSS